MKNRNCITHAVAALCGVALASSTLAAERPHDPGVNARQQGGRSGALTQVEAKSLKQEERAVRQEERADKSEGNLIVAERKDLHQDANRPSHDIHRKKNDVQSKPVTRLPPLPPRRRDPLVNGRQGAQQARIAQGVRAGELTRPEASQLRQQERAIRTEERAYKSDGRLTPAERKDLHQDLNGVGHDIHQQKHDTQTRANPPATPAAR